MGLFTDELSHREKHLFVDLSWTTGSVASYGGASRLFLFFWVGEGTGPVHQTLRGAADGSVTLTIS